MIRIICSQCKNAYLENKGESYSCPSCGAKLSAEFENLVLGIQSYNEGSYSTSADYLMKYIVKNGAEPRAIFYKALCDAFSSVDGDTDSLSDIYNKLIECFKDFSEEDFPEYIALANNEGRKLERFLAEQHVRTLENADAEKIKAEVAAILSIQKEARAFRIALKDVVNEYNENASRKLSVRFSECYLIGRAIAEEVGNKTYNKIIEDIGNHTVFTGILSNNIKNLEIYLRCIVMFFKKSHDKYEFLKDESQKFNQIAELLEQGQYNTIKGVGTTSEKLMKEAYDFLYESYNEHYDEQIEMQTECVVIMEPEAVEEPEQIAEVMVEETAPVAEKPKENNEKATEAPEATVETAEEAEEIVEESEESETDINEEAVDVATEAEASLSEENEISAEEETQEIEEPAEEPAIEETANTKAPIEETPVVENEVKTLARVKAEEAEKSESEAIAEESQKEEFEAKPEEAVQPVIERKAKKKGGKGKILLALVIVLIIAILGVKYLPGAINGYKYKKASTLAESGSYAEAIALFNTISSYDDSAEKAKECAYKNAEKLESEGKFAQAKTAYSELGEYKDCLTRIQTCTYGEATVELDGGNFDKAAKLFAKIKDYGNSTDMIKECSYRKALALTESGDYEGAIELFTKLKKYSDSAKQIKEAKYLYVTNNLDAKNKTTVKYLNELTTAKYKNSADLRKEILGTAEVASGNVKAFVNYSSTDLKTSLTELDHNKGIYFHAIIEDSSLYSKTLTLKYTTQYGYSQTQRVTATESNNAVYMAYPSTSLGNYKVTFELLSPEGTKLASQTITF